MALAGLLPASVTSERSMLLGPRRWKTRALPMRSEASGWYEILPAPSPEPRPVDGRVTCDWAVVGAGACGLAAARRLAELRHQDTIVLIDAARIGYGASGRNAGFMLNHNTHGEIKSLDIERRNSVLCAAGVDYLRQLVRENRIPCQWSDWGRLYVAADHAGDEHLTELAGNYRRLDAPYSWVEPERLHDMLGTPFYRRAIHARGSALVQPAALMRGLGTTLPANVRVCEESPILEISYGARMHLTCPGGVVIARNLILANSVFAEETGVARWRVVPIATYASLTRPLDPEERSRLGCESEFGLLPAHPNGSTLRLTPDHRLFVRNSFRYARTKRIDRDELDRAERLHRQALRRRWPDLADVPFTSTWGGMLGFTRNDGTLFGRVSAGVYVVISSDAGPVARGTIGGKLLAEHVCGVRSELLRVMLSLPKAGLLPPDPFLGMIVKSRLRRIERDGAGGP